MSSTVRHSERGIALLIVVSLLTVIGVIGVTFAFSMYLETQATRQFVSTVRARYLAEGGVAHARALLDEDRLGSHIDDATESWTHDLAGSDVDVDRDGTREARWWVVTDTNKDVVGRYAVTITDEAGKANLNAVQADPPALGVAGVNLTMLLKVVGLDETRAHEAAQAIEQYRYGEDGRPGKAGVDDDGNGAIDDVDEYQPLALRGDDRRIEGLEEVARLAGLTEQEMRRLSRVATVYSWDANISVTGKARINVNTATANELLSVLLEAGVEDPWQAAVNMADAVDPDLEISRVIKSSQLLALSNQGPLGGWTWRDDPEGHYASEEPGGEALSWTVPVPTGTFRVLARGLSGMKVGDVTIAGQLKQSVDQGASLGTFELSGTLQVSVANREPAGTQCAFQGIELVSEGTQSGVMVRGVEAVRFNELMVEPKVAFPVTSASFDPQGSGWGCPFGSSTCVNSGAGQGRWIWTSTTLPSGRYYVRVFGASSGQVVGEVQVDGKSELLVHGQRHPSTLLVGSDGKISLAIGKTDPQKTYYLERVELSLQPDAEYVELINLSDQPIDISGWIIDGELTGGRAAKLPARSIIQPHGLLVAVVDLDDQQASLAGNGIDARSAWNIPRDANAVQLEFPTGAPSPDDDWLKDVLPNGSVARLTLRSAGGVVDEVQYPLPLPTAAAFQSLEKGDPSVIVDRNHDGIDEGWYPARKLYTPGLPNDNDGLKEVVGLDTITHDPSKEVSVLNRPLKGVGELAGLPSGKPWKPFASKDLANLVDRLTVEGIRLEAEGHLGQGQDAWKEKTEGYYEYNNLKPPAVSAAWQWTDIPDGRYRLSVYSCGSCSNEQLSVRWKRQDGTFTDWSPALSTDAQGRMVVGQISIGVDEQSTSAHTLILEVTCGSPNGICHVDHAQLDPQLLRIGPININTAPREVLLALPGMTDALASRVMAGRPYGDQEQKARGIGDLLAGDVLGSTEEDKLAVFRRMAHMLTTRSDVFHILSLGEAMDHNQSTASQRVETVVQR